MKYQEITGNLITLAQNGHFDVIAHGCNCFCTMGAGLAPQMARAFGADKFPMENSQYEGDINKLGTIDYRELEVSTMSCIPKGFKGITTQELRYPLIVVNCYSQFGFGVNHKEGSVAPLDYDALRLCLRKMNHIFKGKRIGLPQIGCHLAGGIWNKDELFEEEYEQFVMSGKTDVISIIKEELKDCDVIVVIYDQK